MITNEERREIAGRLRQFASYPYGGVDREVVEDAIGVEMREFFGRDELLNMAELIEPEPERTCRKVPGRMRYGERKQKCSECGYSLGDPRWFYCPKCGGRIEE